MKEFITAALPWIIMGLSVLVVIMNKSKSTKDDYGPIGPGTCFTKE